MAPDPFDHESIELQARHGDIFGQYDDRFGRRSSRRARHTNAGPAPYEDIPEVKDIDFRKAQKFRGWSVLPLAYQATGVAHGQISISLLYVYSSTFSHDPSAEDVKGALSLIIWSLILVVTIKYSLIILYADDEGEGGTFAVFSLLSRHCNMACQDTLRSRPVKVERRSSEDLRSISLCIRNWLEKSPLTRFILKTLAVFGVSLVIADGVLTPAQSVLGAVEGIAVAEPGLTSSTIIGASCVILVFLFSIQSLGIDRISCTFAPVIVLWLLFNASYGIYNLAMHDRSVLAAFSPHHAIAWFQRNDNAGFDRLGGILLAFSGVECLFAVMGAFTRLAVQLSWLCFVFPCLLLAYVGQAAYLLDEPKEWNNSFFRTVPPGMLYPSLVISILAAIVASQGTITACFQLLAQIMNAGYFPHLDLKYTSNKYYGQVYIPKANWILMIGCIIVTVVYGNTQELGHAYGTCVILVTFITTVLVVLVAIVVWQFHPALVFAVWLPFLALGGLFLGAALTKVPDGAWFTLILAGVLVVFFTLWRFGKEKQWECESKDQVDLRDVVETGRYTTHQFLATKYGGYELTPMDGFGIFFDKFGGTTTPRVYIQWLLKFRAQLDVVVLMHIRSLSIPHVGSDEQFEVNRTSIKNVYHVTLRHGYNDHVVTADLARMVYEEVRRTMLQGMTRRVFSSAPAPETHPGTDISDLSISSWLRQIDVAYASQSLYVVGKQQMRIDPQYCVVKRLALQVFLWIRQHSRSKIEKLAVPVQDLVEIGWIGKI
ncbi:unnamed protein product [Zymoseptoria tritici ST99CH_3D1]|nr:unnamed protein product [Zymoseptoria tritici ST99CH_3D1]